MSAGGAALKYAAKGWRVFPLHSVTAHLLDLICTCGRGDCSSVGKHPRTRTGVLEATTDPLIIAGWWQTWPDANVGVATGSESGIYVVDLDGPDAVKAWGELGLPNGWKSRTGNGVHLVYSIAEPLPSTHWKLGRGIDTRGDGGYIVAPPSRHRSGKSYAWDAATVTTDYPPALPAGLVEAVTPRIATPAASPRVSLGDSTKYGSGVLKNAAARISGAPKGTRNETLNAEAFLVGQFIGGGEINPMGVAAMLEAASTDDDRKKVRTSVARGLRDGSMHPRRAPQ